MATYFVTGSTGFIGKELTLKLLNAGNKVHLLVRDKNRAKDLTGENTFIF